jgi:hypothetical protein
MVAGKTVVEYTDGPAAETIRNIWNEFRDFVGVDS